MDEILAHHCVRIVLCQNEQSGSDVRETKYCYFFLMVFLG